MRRSLVLMVICVGVTTLSTLQGSIFGAALPLIVGDLGIDWGLMGLMIAAWTVLCALSPFVLGRYVHEAPPLTAVTVVMLLLSLSSIALTAVRDLVALNLVRVASSLAIAFPFPLAARVVTSHVSEHRRGLATAIYGTGSMIGLALAYVVIALSGSHWRLATLVAGLLGIAFLPVAFGLWKYAFPSPDAEKPLQADPAGKPDPDRTIASGPFPYGLVLLLMLGHFCAVYTWNLMFNWLSTFLVRDLALPYGAIALSLSAMALVASVAEVLIGVRSDRLRGFRGRVLPLFMGFIPSVVLLTVAPWIPSALIAGILMSFAILTWRLASPSFWSIFSDLVPLAHFGKASNMYMLAVFASGISSSVINGYLVSLTGSMRYPILLSALILLFSPLFYTLAAKRVYCAHPASA
ncbi:MFS transporter [Spirochaeta thermophila]|uniref:Major facilitator superfamily permease/putative D-galactonate transporter n=1 Tax=Winmispira thermophila (strain ATCC 49972 / DSM 6192 / RI 19.B1) TaxID=665571 RepID=E0RSY1_WINT6|nr:MFS transporter [Spirochaeta thermophila]ADN02118.1 major facilitator superfamily permease/putative D-galactonate transporter [Spirochaeta thermophila DSM 6192]